MVVGRRKGAEVEANPWLLRTKSLMLLTPSPEYMHPDMRITPEMVPQTLAITLTLALTLSLILFPNTCDSFYKPSPSPSPEP